MRSGQAAGAQAHQVARRTGYCRVRVGQLARIPSMEFIVLSKRLNITSLMVAYKFSLESRGPCTYISCLQLLKPAIPIPA